MVARFVRQIAKSRQQFKPRNNCVRDCDEQGKKVKLFIGKLNRVALGRKEDPSPAYKSPVCLWLRRYWLLSGQDVRLYRWLGHTAKKP